MKLIKAFLLLCAFAPLAAQQCNALTVSDFEWNDWEVEEVNERYYVVFYFYHFVMFSPCDWGCDYE